MRKLLFCLLLSGCATTENNFGTAMSEFRTKPPHRAAAVIYENGRTAWGMWAGAPDQETAQKKALQICNGSAAKHGFSGECSLVKE
jgi:hypothetical protein